MRGYNLPEDVYSNLFRSQPDLTVVQQEEDKNSVRALI